MKRIQSILLAIAMLLAAPAFFTSCQEDAPEINYTMNVSVINDFTKVVEAINNGFLKNEEAIKKLTESIDKMNADQQTKLQAIIGTQLRERHARDQARSHRGSDAGADAHARSKARPLGEGREQPDHQD